MRVFSQSRPPVPMHREMPLSVPMKVGRLKKLYGAGQPKP